MRSLRSSLLIAPIVALASMTAMGADGLEESAILEAFLPIGKERRCLNITRMREYRVLSDRYVLFLVGEELFLNRMRGACLGLFREQRFSRPRRGNRMCTGELVVITDRTGAQRGECALGRFQPVEMAVDPQPAGLDADSAQQAAGGKCNSGCQETGCDAWVNVAYDVSEELKPINLRVVESCADSSVEAFEKSALDVVKTMELERNLAGTKAQTIQISFRQQ